MKTLLDKLKWVVSTLDGFFYASFILSILGTAIFVIDYGFDQAHWIQVVFNFFYLLILLTGVAVTVIRHVTKKRRAEIKVRVFDLLSVAFTGFILFEMIRDLSFELVERNHLIIVGVLLTFVRELSERRVNYVRNTINPAQLFIISFLGLIFLGALLLMLPNATVDGISFVNALFTSTSAVCVTGLAVVDTSAVFTQFGLVIIMLLIQIGGLGILTFAMYFSYFFKGGSSYENQLSIGEITNAQKLGEVFKTLKRILIITFTIELIGGIMIFTSLDAKLFASFWEHAFFSMFHSVSSFCNAGFSTFSNGLYESSVRFNYWLQLSIIFLFVLGGLGFPIVVNIMKYTKYFILTKILLLQKGMRNHRPWVLNLNSRITLITTVTLTVVGTILFFITEYNNVLADHSGFGKFVTALFGATTPRTAGFNTIDMATLEFSTVMLIFFLMWIGASPASTGGGIKTSTFAIATLNFFSLARGKTRIEIYRREIADISVRRAFAVISLSLVVIGGGVIALSITDPEKDLMGIAFECFSAYSTVGLTVGVTMKLSVAGKVVIILLMFIGRVSMLTILIAVFKKVKHKNYRYPAEEIMIN